MKLLKNFIFFIFILLITSSFISGAYTRSVISTTGVASLNSFTENSLAFDKSMCETSRTDFILQIVPLSCEPVVVRSDLLEENDVPVFCQIGATKINPLVDVDAIENMDIHLNGSADGIKTITYLRSQSALGLVPDGSLSNDLMNNLGYVVIVLERNSNESSMPEYIKGNLSAKIRYDLKGSWGLGNAEFILPQLSDEKFEENHEQYTFWKGRGYLRAEDVGVDSATISVYADATTTSISGEESKLEYTSRSLKVGEESSEIYLPGFTPCSAGFTLKLNGVEYPETTVRLRINSDVIEVKENERFLNERCFVGKIESRGIYQAIELKCKDDEEGWLPVKKLSISPKIKLGIQDENNKQDDVIRDYELGDKLYDYKDVEGKTNSVYLGYVGSSSKVDLTDPTLIDSTYVVLVSIPNTYNTEDKLSDEDLRSVATYIKYRKNEYSSGASFLDSAVNGFSKFSSLTVGTLKTIITGESVIIVPKQDSKGFDREIPFKGHSVRIIGFGEGSDYVSLVSLNTDYKAPYDDAINDFNTVINSYNEQKEDSQDEHTLGERALFESIKLSSKVRLNQKVKELCDEFERKYPESGYEYDLRAYCSDLAISSQSDTQLEVSIDGDVKVISFERIIEPTPDEYGIEILVQNKTGNSKTFKLAKGDTAYLSEVRGEDAGEYIKLESIDDEEGYARIYVYVTENMYSRVFKTNTETFELNSGKNIGSYTFTLKAVNTKRVARVSIESKVNNQYSYSNFPFTIGIEKRAIQLSDEKISDKIESLNDSIENLQKTVDFLEGVVVWGNKICSYTGVGLNAINLINNLNGKSIARTTVMQQKGGWNEKCQAEVAKGTYKSLDVCFLENSDEIDKEVDLYTKVINERNSEVDGFKEDATTTNKKGDEILDRTNFIDIYSKDVTGDLINVLKSTGYVDSSNNRFYQIKDSKGNLAGNFVDLDELSITFSTGALDAAVYSEEELNEIYLYKEVLKANSGDATARNKLFSLLYQADNNAESYKTQDSFERESGLGESTAIIDVDPKKQTQEIRVNSYKTFSDSEYSSNSYRILTGTISPGDYVYGIVDKATGKKYLVVYNVDGIVQKTFIISDKTLSLHEYQNPLNLFFKKYDRGSYVNGYVNPEIKFYSSNINKGYPALVPFNSKEGWYIAPISYYDSGAVSSFYLCNVGTNGLQENVHTDDCQFFQEPITNYGPLEEVLGTEKVRNLISESKNALSKVQKSTKRSAGSKISIGGIGYNIGTPETGATSTQCQDLMSPKDCSLLFNVCDPFVCPSSRCNLGGTYPVNDVVQSGVIGSLMLCYPNAKWNEGDVYIPVCVSGVQAGLDGWLQIKKAYQSCLQEQLDSGEVVGICDEVQSVYMCDFFWSQATPLLKMGLPKLIGAVMGGGGEYENVQSALSNSKSSLDYFKQYYAKEAYSAFKIGSTSEIGTEVCKNFISVIFPDTVDVLDSLSEAQSPAQFSAKFEETTLTTRTNPPLSHYKVFYHIYAGKNAGSYYQVYLKGENNVESSYYMDIGVNRVIASGYINIGESKSETIDKQLPSGYTQLCVIVNGQETCGFKKVSTSFAVNYATEYYLSQQANETNIKTTEECTQGTSSWYSILLSMNAQEAAEQLLDSDVSELGLIRTCASINPGENTENTRWVKVGYCDNINLGCWLDTDSVRDIIKATNLEDSVLETTTKSYLDELFNTGNYLSPQQFKENITEAQDASKTYQQRIAIINKILPNLFWDSQKGFAYFIRGKIYAESIQVKDCPDVCGNSYGNDLGNVYYSVSDKEGKECHTTNTLKRDCITEKKTCSGGVCVAGTGSTTTGSTVPSQTSSGAPIQVSLYPNWIVNVNFNNKNYPFVLNVIGFQQATITLNSVQSTILLNTVQNFDVDGDNSEDFSITLNTAGMPASISFTPLNGKTISLSIVETTQNIYQIDPTFIEFRGVTVYYRCSNENFWEFSFNKNTWFATQVTIENKEYNGNRLTNRNMEIINSFKTGIPCDAGGEILINDYGAMSITVPISSTSGTGTTGTTSTGTTGTGSTTTSSQEIFVIEATWLQSIGGGTNMYYKYDNGWKWTPYSDKSIWMSVTTTEVTSGEYKGESVSNKNENIIESLRGVNYINGKKILKEEGGIMEDGSEISLSSTTGTTGTGSTTQTAPQEVSLGNTDILIFKFNNQEYIWNTAISTLAPTAALIVLNGHPEYFEVTPNVYTNSVKQIDWDLDENGVNDLRIILKSFENMKATFSFSTLNGASIVYTRSSASSNSGTPTSPIIPPISNTGQEKDCNDGQETCTGTIYYECISGRWVNRGEVPGKCDYFTEEELEVINDAKECSDCGDGTWYTFGLSNRCEEDECKAIDKKLTDKECIFSNGNCIEKATSPSSSTSCQNNGRWGCIGATAYTCENNNWINKGIVKGHCGVECTANEKKCESPNSYICGSNYRWVSKGPTVGECGVECISGEKCVGTLYYTCSSYKWVSQGKNTVKCPEGSNSGTTTLSATRQKVLDAAAALNLKPRSVISDQDNDGYIVCWDAAVQVYKNAGCIYDTSPCFYSDKKGKEYTYEGTKIYMGETANSKGAIIFTTTSRCGKTDLSESAKLNLLQPGDLLSLVYDEDSGHNVIFINWVDKANWKANVSDWGAFSNVKYYKYTTIDISDNEHSVYRIWQPK